MSHGERGPRRTIPPRAFASRHPGVRLDVAPTSRGDSHVQVWARDGKRSVLLSLGPDALRALIADLRERLDVLEAFAPEGVR